jgi:hypothetical protein
MSLSEVSDWSVNLLRPGLNVATGPSASVMEPATGDALGEIAVGTVKDVNAAARREGATGLGADSLRGAGSGAATRR